MARKKQHSDEQARLIATTHNNHYLFSDYYLNELVVDTEEWQKGDGIEKAFREISELYNKVKTTIEKANESQTEERFIKPVLEILGHYIEVQTKAPQIDHAKRPDYAFFADEKTKEKAFAEIGSKEYFNYVMAVGDAKSWNRPLDKKIKTHRGDPFNNANPNFQMDYYLRITNKMWGILTNGPKWRLYNRDVSYLLDHYYEVDLVTLIEQGKIDEFKYFYLFFRRIALIKDAFLDKAYKQSKDYAVGIEENLKDRVYEALIRLAKGFWEYEGNKFTENDLKVIHDNCLTVLYQLLFIFNAECRGLLPSQNKTYTSTYSLKGISKEIVDKLDNKIELLPNVDNIWSKFISLLKLIYQGNEHLGITYFDGGLFDIKQHEFINKYSIGDKHLAEAIDRLYRAKTKKGLAPIDYRDLGIRHLGGIYEGILEYKLHLSKEDMVAYKEKGKEKYLPLSEAEKSGIKYKADDVIKKGEIYLITDKGERKATGSYFTPEYIVNYIVENTLGPIVEGKKPKEILELNVLDPAMGSGHFLLGATDYLAKAIHEKEAGGEYLSEEEVDDEINDIRRHVVERCVNGVDINPLAVELAKLTLWLHTMAKGKPLNFLDHNLKCGNSLIGTKISDLGRLPVLKKKKEKETSIKLPGMDAFFSGYKHDLGPILDWIIKIEYKTTDSPEDIKIKKSALEYVEKITAKYKQVADLWISKYYDNEYDQGLYKDAVDYILKGKSQLPERKIQQYIHKAQELKKEKKYFHWELEFPEVFFDKYGRTLDSPGFDAVIGNPPYVASRGGKIEIQDKIYLNIKYDHAKGGKPDIYRYFIEEAIHLCKDSCFLSFITPNTWITIPETKYLRKYILENTYIVCIVSLPKKVFPEAGVNSNVFILKKVKEKGKNTTKVIIIDESVSNEIAENKYSLIRQDEWYDEKYYQFNIYIDKKKNNVFKKIRNQSIKMGEIAEVSPGVQPYAVGYGASPSGKPLTKEEVKNQIYNSNKQIDETYIKELDGLDVKRYEIDWNGNKWLKYGKHLHCPREWKYFSGSRILIREITGSSGHVLTATITRDEYVFTPSILSIIIIHNKHTFSPYFILSILNSLLITFYHLNYSVKAKKELFPKIITKDIREFPVRCIRFSTPEAARKEIISKLKRLYVNMIERPN